MKGNINNRRYMAEKSKPLTEGPTKTNVKKSTGLTKAAPPPAPKPAKNAKVAVSRAIGTPGKFDSKLLDKFKKAKNLGLNAGFKPQEWYPLSAAFNKVIGLPGIPKGQITLFRGLSDTGKSTALWEAAVEAQRQGDLVVFIITEMKFTWDRLIKLGFETQEGVDEETGEVIHTGDFIFADRTTLPSIEAVGAFMLDLIGEQEKGKLPYNLTFIVDSFGSVPCDMALSLGKNDNRWNAAAMSSTFANFINFRFASSRKLTYPYTNTMIAINKQGIQYPATPMEKPKRTSKGGSSLYFDAALVVDFGNITNAGTSKLEASKNSKKVVFAKSVKISVDKNHVTNATTSGRVVMTDYGFIEDTKASIEAYKEEHKHEWLEVLGSTDFDIVREADVPEDKITAGSAFATEEE